nr:type IX secretion system sortase PorU [Penaeicola halotolerans]
MVFCLYAIQSTAQSASVFTSGDWIAVEISEDGIYKITAAQLRSLGFNPNTIRTDEVALFAGNSKMLPQSLAQAFDSDPHPISFELSATSNGFLSNDGAIIFYAEGPHQLIYQEEVVRYEHHLYSDTNYYFLRLNAGPGVRPLRNTSISGSFDEVNQVTETLVYKEDTHNILNSGRVWYSDRFEQNLNKNLNFDLRGLVSSDPVNIQLELMSQSTATSNFSLSAAGSNVATVSMNPISAGIYSKRGFERSFSVDITANSPTLNLQLTYDKQGQSNAVGYLKSILVSYQKKLTLGNIPFIFDPRNHNMDLKTYIFDQNLADQIIWDLSDRTFVKTIQTSDNQFTSGAKGPFAVFKIDQVPQVSQLTRIANQNLLNPSTVDMLIISPASLLGVAEAYAQYRSEKNNIQVLTVSSEDIYRQFSSGKQDPTALRNFIKYVKEQSNDQLKYVLFIGKATFDYKNKLGLNNHLLASYQSRDHLNPLLTYSSDDYFGFMDSDEGDWPEENPINHSLDMAIGRIPARNRQEARDYLNKIIHYEQQFGKWRQKVVFIADDADNNLHLNDAEKLSQHVDTVATGYRIDKLYLDSFEQIQSPTGQRSPNASNALQRTIDEGALLINYTGHGNETTLMAEQIFTNSDLNNWKNIDRLPVFITATCEFGRHDSPFIRSGAEEMLFKPDGGAIAMLTTSRPVFSSTNFQLNEAFITQAFRADATQDQTLGEIFQITKNESQNGVLNRNFILLGDPAMLLFRANPQITLTAQDQVSDTLRANQHVSWSGAITQNSNLVRDFDGAFEYELIDKLTRFQTLGDESSSTQYALRDKIIARGSGEIRNGEFSISELIGEAIDYSIGEGRLRVYAFDEQKEVVSGLNDFKIGGSLSSISDQTPPEIRMYINDTTKQIRSIASRRALLIANLVDLSGINLSDAIIGRSPILTINGDRTIALNSEIKSLGGDFTKNILMIEIDSLKEGNNTLEISAWDRAGNRATANLEVVVNGSNRIKILTLNNYPNPANAETTFSFSHNRPNQNLQIQFTVYDLYGKKILNYTTAINRASEKIDILTWNIFQNKVNIPTKGIYIYVLEVIDREDGSSDSSTGKLLID